MGIGARWIETKAATRVCTTLLDQGRGCTTELVENGAALSTEEQAAFRDAFQEEVENAKIVILSGSLPPGITADFFQGLLSESMQQAPLPQGARGGCSHGLSGTTAKVILDIRGKELMSCLAVRPFLVKPNREELSRTVGKDLHSEANLIQAMKELNRRGAEWVVITEGAKNLFVSSQDMVHRIQPPKCKVVNPIGSGDCMTAGIACALMQGWATLDAIRFGVAAAADNVSQLLIGRLNLARVQEIFRNIQVTPYTSDHHV